MEGTENANSEDVMRILVATDNHLGYGEKDIFRGEDSFTAFEEILEYAVTENVDFILLGGDLFHDSVPSQNALEKCMTLLRRYTFGSKPISIEFLNDESNVFHNSVNDTVNYEDPNINVSIPVFSIHGNHDEPCGLGRLSSLDLLSVNGLVNYFGRWKDITEVEIKPLLLRKGETKLALYGLSHIHDLRLARLFESHKVGIDRQYSKEDDWFQLLVVHQNRCDRGPKNYLPEDVLWDFLHLVVWGHEHDCLIEPQLNTKQGFYVTQPGSSVPTSLAEGEAKKKHVGLLEIYKTKFKLTPLPLKTVRPFIFESVNIPDIAEELCLDKGDISNKVQEMAKKRVEDMIEKADAMRTDHPKQPKLPLIRLRLIYSEEEQMFNTIRFGQTFNDRVANPADIVAFKKMERKVRTKKDKGGHLQEEMMDEAFQKVEQNPNARVEDLLEQYFENIKSTQSQILPSKMMSELCYQLVERDDDHAVQTMLNNYKKKALSHLMETLPLEDKIDEQLCLLRDRITPEDITNMCFDEKTSGGKSFSKKSIPNRLENKNNTGNENDENEMEEATLSSANNTINKSTRGRRGRGGGGATASNATTTRGTRSTNISTAAVATKSRAQTRAPALDVSISSKRTTRQLGPSKQKIYVVSDSSDSDR